MRIILDANIIISALLGSRGKLTIITSQNHEFYCPSTIIDEIKKYKRDICEKLVSNPKEFEDNLNALLFFIKIIKYAEYETFISRARESIKERDIKDADYIACSLAIGADFIWTEDKDFSSQTIVSVKNTEDFLEDGKCS